MYMPLPAISVRALQIFGRAVRVRDRIFAPLR